MEVWGGAPLVQVTAQYGGCKVGAMPGACEGTTRGHSLVKAAEAVF